MAIDTTTGWTRAKDPVEIATKSQKIKLTGLTLDEGDLLQLQENTTLETLELLDCTIAFAAGQFDFNDLPGVQAAATLESIDLTGSTGIVGAPSTDWEACEKLADVSINDCNYDEDAIDAFLIAMAAAVAGTPGLGSDTTPGTINVAGASNGIRTTASDDAVTDLEAANFTITENS